MDITPTTLVLLKTKVRGKSREILTTPGQGELHTDLGVLHLRELVHCNWGDQITTHLGHPFTLCRPRAPDIFRHLPRSSTPLMPKDIASIIAHTGLSGSDVVLEAGTGTGVLTVYLAGIAKHVTSYEIRTEVFEKARKNIESLGLTNITLHNRDFLQEIPSINQHFDVIILDMPDAHKTLPQILRLLHPGGYLAIYTPYIEQARLVHDQLRDEAPEATTIEVFEREIRFSEKGTRPSTQRVGHTGYLTYVKRGHM